MRGKSVALPLAIAVAAALVTLASLEEEAGAFCRTATCENDVIGAVCTPAEQSDCGIPLYWPTKCVGYSVQKDASAEVNLATVTELVAQAFATWQAASCAEGGNPDIQAINLGPVSCDQVEYDAENKNANIIVFRDSSWPHDGMSALALTTVTFALDSGKIRDADIELNSASANFTTSDVAVGTDLLSILTHETGHFLGLAHAPSGDATMFADYPPESVSLRSLDPDDEAGICAIYPAGSTATCDPTPKNGLGDACSTPADGDDGDDGTDDDGNPDGGDADDGCSATGGAPPTRPISLALFVAIAVGLGRARRR